jgi:outer membrane protein
MFFVLKLINAHLLYLFRNPVAEVVILKPFLLPQFSMYNYKVEITEVVVEKRIKNILVYVWSIFSLVLLPQTAQSLTLDEAISLAKETLPVYKASMIKTRSTEALYNASLGPYLPSLDASTVQNRIYTSAEEFSSGSSDVTLSYTLFDGGNRKASRNIARLNLDISKEDLRKSLLDLEFNTKTAFYSSIAKRDVLGQRKIQLQDAQKDYEVAEGRHKFGVATLLDVLQASVRLEQSKFALVQAEGDFRKAALDLSSLIGKPLDSRYEVEGSLDMEVKIPSRDALSTVILERPEIKQAEASLRIAENNKSISLSTFYPLITANASYEKSSGGLQAVAVGQPFIAEQKTVGITATWNIFELGKVFRAKSSEFEKGVSLENLNDLKRQLLLDVNKAYEDLVTASDNLEVARQQLKQAEQNYQQAFGEYKVGKADILSLVQAESLFAGAREQFINSRLNLVLSGASLERIAGIESLKSLSSH